MPRKKSQITELKNIILIGLVGGILLILFLTNILPAFQDTNRKAECQHSIWLAALSKKLTGNPLTSPDCEPGEIELTVKGKHGIVGKDGVVDQDLAHKIIADALAQCWWMVGEGKWDPFTNYDLEEIPLCIICDRISFSDDLLSYMSTGIREGGSTQEKRAFLIDNPLPFIMQTNIPQTEVTYFEYLYKKRPDQIGMGETKPSDLINYPFGESTIIVQMIKGDEKTTWEEATVWIAAGAGVLIAVVGVLAAPVTFGQSLWLETIGIGLITGIAVVGSATVLIPQAMSYTYSECPTCNAVGGIVLVPDNIDISDKKSIVFKGEDREFPLCSIIVN